MLIKKYTFILASLFFFLFSCATENDNQKIIGQWQGITWDVGGRASGRKAADVVFQFNPDDTYTASFGQQKEEGNFRLKGNKLYTTATGKAEKMVRVTLRSVDTLAMDMNRVGTLEELVLVKQ
ncbi:MAG TPA: hypothetical protein ENJ95_23690 [Bacteroidetes bacterium]|nr:hypothetical protein [Bacteroidota bacterium]